MRAFGTWCANPIGTTENEGSLPCVFGGPACGFRGEGSLTTFDQLGVVAS
jgi:hypothetical protein